MSTRDRRTPPGPTDAYSSTEDLLPWLHTHFLRYGDIYQAVVYGTPVYVVSSPEYAGHVLLRNWENYVKGQAIKRIALLLGNGLMVSKGDFWKRQRRMIQPAFARKSIDALSDMIQQVNTALLERWQAAATQSGCVNVTRDTSRMALEVVLRAIFGEDYLRAAPHFDLVTGEPARDLEFAQTFTALRRIVLEVAHDRRKRAEASTDILATLMSARDRDDDLAMSDAQLAREVMTLIVAGHETTASTLNWTWYLLAQHPEVADKLGEELRRLAQETFPGPEDMPKFVYTRRVLEEALRLYPPGWLMTRRALRDDSLGEYFVPAGTEIYLSPYLIQRNPMLWENPERFDPDRFGPVHGTEQQALATVPFSSGPRNCIGEHLARLEMQIHLMIIAGRLRLRYAAENPPAMLAGVNLLSAQEFIMTPESLP
jgi:cytochrome P450